MHCEWQIHRYTAHVPYYTCPRIVTSSWYDPATTAAATFTEHSNRIHDNALRECDNRLLASRHPLSTTYTTHSIHSTHTTQHISTTPPTSSSPAHTYHSLLSSSLLSLPHVMGFGLTAVCTVAAFSSRITFYNNAVFIPFWTGIVNGGNCSVALDTFTGDANDLIEVFNITTAGQMQAEPLSCNISANLGCTTNYFSFSGLPYEQTTFDFYALSPSGGLSNAVNWTYYILPPVPSQPVPANLVNGGSQVVYTTSQYSSEYGAPLIGCVIAAGGPYQWTPPAGTFPATLSSTPSQNSLPNNTAVAYAPAQNTNITVSTSSLGLAVGSNNDFWVQCYNANGPSRASVRFNQTTGKNAAAAGAYGSAIAAAMIAAVTWGVVGLMW